MKRAVRSTKRSEISRTSINDDLIGYASHLSSRHRFFSAIVPVRASKSLGLARGAYPSARAETRPIFRAAQEASRRNSSARIAEIFSDALSGRAPPRNEKGEREEKASVVEGKKRGWRISSVRALAGLWHAGVYH